MSNHKQNHRGRIRSKAQADKMIRQLKAIGTPMAEDAASLVERNWRVDLFKQTMDCDRYWRGLED